MSVATPTKRLYCYASCSIPNSMRCKIRWAEFRPISILKASYPDEDSTVEEANR